MSKELIWHASCATGGVMRRHLAGLKKGWRFVSLAGALLLAAIIPAPHHDAGQGQIFSVVGSDFSSPLISSPRGIQALNALMGSGAWFAGYDQIHSLVSAGSTREMAVVTRYSGDIFSLLGAEFVVRAKAGMVERPIVISEEFWNRMLGGTPDVLGRTVEACGERFRIAGVMRSSMLLGETEVWIPLSTRGEFGTVTALRVVGQLQPGMNWKEGEKQLERLIESDPVKEQVFEEFGSVRLLPVDRRMMIYAPRESSSV
jgi:hypothetical protein